MTIALRDPRQALRIALAPRSIAVIGASVHRRDTGVLRRDRGAHLVGRRRRLAIDPAELLALHHHARLHDGLALTRRGEGGDFFVVEGAGKFPPRVVVRVPSADQLQETAGKRGLATMCVGVGQGIALAIERA